MVQNKHNFLSFQYFGRIVNVPAMSEFIFFFTVGLFFAEILRLHFCSIGENSAGPLFFQRRFRYFSALWGFSRRSKNDDAWTVHQRLANIFDNIIVTDSLAEAKAFYDQTNGATKDAEKKAFDSAEADKRKKEEDERKKQEEEEKKTAEQAAVSQMSVPTPNERWNPPGFSVQKGPAKQNSQFHSRGRSLSVGFFSSVGRRGVLIANFSKIKKEPAGEEDEDDDDEEEEEDDKKDEL